MKLRAKLFLATLCLIVIMLSITYFLPAYLVQQDIANISEEIYHSIIQSSQNEVAHQKEWFIQAMHTRQEEIKLLLFNIQNDKSISEKLVFSPNVSKKERWLETAKIISSSPEVSILQLYSSLYEEANVLFYDKAQLYQAILVEKASGDNIIIIPKKKRIYQGYKLPEKPNIFILRRPIVPQNVQNELLEKYSSWADKFSPETLSVEWYLKNQLLDLLAPLHAEGVHLPGIEEVIVPDGIFLLQKNDDGIAFLTKEAFQNTPILIVEDSFEASIPLEQQKPVLLLDQNGQFYLTYTILVENTFISAGISLASLLSDFAVASQKSFLLTPGQNWLGYDSKGEEISQNVIFQFLEESNFADAQGTVTLQGQPYFFSQLQLFKDNDLKLYSLYPLSAEQSILNTLKTLVSTLSNKILLYILFIGLLMVGISLFVIFMLTKSIVKPLENFVLSTKQIAAGKFDQVHLPKLGHRKDELAELSKAFEQMIIDMKERENIRSVLNKVISKEIASEFLNAEVHLGGEDRIVTMLFSDIRGFTALTENLSPQKVIKALNLYMTHMSEIIESKHGIIDKFVGDEIMAIFGAPVFHSDHSLQAISAGLLMLDAVKTLNEEMKILNEPIFEIGIGVHTGPVVAGNMGAENRMNYTVLGKNVNLAARLCTAAKPGQLLVSEHTYKAPNIEHKFIAHQLEPIVLKGFSEPINIYEITGLKT